MNGIALGAGGSAFVTGTTTSFTNSHGHGKLDRYPVKPYNFKMNNIGGTGCYIGAGCSDAVVGKITGL